MGDDEVGDDVGTGRTSVKQNSQLFGQASRTVLPLLKYSGVLQYLSMRSSFLAGFFTSQSHLTSRVLLFFSVNL